MGIDDRATSVVDLEGPDIAQGRALITDLAAADPVAGIVWLQMLRRAARRTPKGQDGGVVTATIRGLAQAQLQALDRRGALSMADGELVATAPGQALLRALEGGTPTQRDAVWLLLVRSASASAALLTWPRDELLDTEQLGWDPSLPSEHPRGELPEQHPGTDMRYGGYLCLIVKVTRLCNLRCVYCHDWSSDRTTHMPAEVLWTLFRQTLGDPRYRLVDVVWHGGEPMMLGRRRMQQVLALQQAATRPGVIVRNVLQTNGTMVTPGMAEFLREHGFRVSLSLDGPAEHHDRARPDIHGRGTFARVTRGLGLLREAQVLSGVLMVVTDEVIARGAQELVELCTHLGITDLGLLAMRPGYGERGGTSLSAYVAFLGEVDRAIRRSGVPLKVRELDSVERLLSGTQAYHCELLGGCLGHYFSVEADGSVYHCDKFTPDPRYRLGSVLDEPFEVLRSRVRPLVAEWERTRQGYASCPWFASCRGWCPHEAYVRPRIEQGSPESAACCGLAPLFEELSQATPTSSGLVEVVS